MLELITNLFGEYLLIRTYGSCKNTRPTGVISNTYETLMDAKTAIEEVLYEKFKRGYRSSNESMKH